MWGEVSGEHITDRHTEEGPNVENDRHENLKSHMM
jgi:hypothetical protein